MLHLQCWRSLAFAQIHHSSECELESLRWAVFTGQKGIGSWLHLRCIQVETGDYVTVERSSVIFCTSLSRDWSRCAVW